MSSCLVEKIIIIVVSLWNGNVVQGRYSWAEPFLIKLVVGGEHPREGYITALRGELRIGASLSQPSFHLVCATIYRD